jgi:hypothetical protein
VRRAPVAAAGSGPTTWADAGGVPAPRSLTAVVAAPWASAAEVAAPVVRPAAVEVLRGSMGVEEERRKANDEQRRLLALRLGRWRGGGSPVLERRRRLGLRVGREGREKKTLLYTMWKPLTLTQCWVLY